MFTGVFSWPMSHPRRPRSPRTEEAATLDWNVMQCRCGEIVLECGPVSLRMTRHDLARLHRLTQAAMERFRIDACTADVGVHSDELLH
jgi:hypothetical protein